MRVYVALDLTLSILPDYIDCKALWVDFGNEPEPKLCYQLTPELYLRVEAKVADLGAKVMAGKASRESYAVASGRFLALQDAISVLVDPGAVAACRETWRAKIGAGELPPLPPAPPACNFPNFDLWTSEQFKSWVDSYLMTKASQ